MKKTTKDDRCDQTRFGRATDKGVIAPIYSVNNKPNEKGICYMYGKKAGKIKKNKVLKEKEEENVESA